MNQLTNRRRAKPFLNEICTEQIGLRRAAIYLRVSTKRQADGEVSIPSQRDLCTRYAEGRGYKVCSEFVDAGSATDDRNRPEFRRMLAAVTIEPPAFDVIIVHAFHRFYRNGPVSELTMRDLAKRRVIVESVTQSVSDDPTGKIGRQIFGIFDEYSSLQNSVNVKRGMDQNASQGFWNGARPPLGYQSVTVEIRGKKQKKKLKINSTEAELVRLIFRLYADGACETPPLGIAMLVNYLNDYGYRTRLGARFGKGAVGKILRAAYYVTGQFMHGSGGERLEADSGQSGIAIPIPIIIEQDLFDRVQSKLDRNNARITPPRIVNGPILLSGLARCARCGSSMTRTGTVRADRTYSYYTCAGAHVTGQPQCRGLHLPMQKLDAQVTEAVIERLVRPDLLSKLFTGISARRSTSTQRAQERIAGLQASVDEAEGKLKRLYRLVEVSDTESDDLLLERMRELRVDADRYRRALGTARDEITPTIAPDAEKIGRFSHLVATALRVGDIQARRIYLQAIIDRIEIERGTVRIIGRKSSIEAAVMGRKPTNENVRGFDPEWRTRHETTGAPARH
jgi:site-specific DNA recombinase